MTGKKGNEDFKHRWPIGWRPGKAGTAFKGPVHPSIVRDRNPLTRKILDWGVQEGHTHAVFVANPTCCPICKHLDGRTQRLKTVLSWKYPLPHPNCRCSWRTRGIPMRKAEQLEDKKALAVAENKEKTYVVSAQKQPDKKLEEQPESALNANARKQLNSLVTELRKLQTKEVIAKQQVSKDKDGNFVIQGMKFVGLKEASLALYALKLISQQENVED